MGMHTRVKLLLSMQPPQDQIVTTRSTARVCSVNNLNIGDKLITAHSKLKLEAISQLVAKLGTLCNHTYLTFPVADSKHLVEMWMSILAIFTTHHAGPST